MRAFLRPVAASIVVGSVGAGAGGAAAQSAQLLGEFRLVTLDGGPLPAPSPDQPGLTIHSLTLTLTRERFALGSTFSRGDSAIQSAPLLSGPYQLTASEMLFHPEQAPAGTTVVFRYQWRDTRLVLTDANEHRWAMEKQRDSTRFWWKAATRSCRLLESLGSVRSRGADELTGRGGRARVSRSLLPPALPPPPP
jgi:hypothetical protein